MHVIGTDYDSPSLKTKQHWNSFTTQFFVGSKCKITISEVPFIDFTFFFAIARCVRQDQGERTHYGSIHVICFALDHLTVPSFQIDKAAYENLIKKPLRCHKCSHEPKTMPALKLHLKTHFPS